MITKKAPTKVPAKYLDFANVISPDLVSEIPKHTRIKNHIIKLVNSQQPPYVPIYSLKSVELETLKTYIKNNLANRFIRPSKSPAGASIFFDQKSDGSFRLWVGYQDLNNLIIKNQYLLPLIKESLDVLLGFANFYKHFIQRFS